MIRRGLAALVAALVLTAAGTVVPAVAYAEDDPPSKEERDAGFRDFARCMREEGIEIADPTVRDGGGLVFGQGPGDGGNTGPPEGGERAAEPSPAFKRAEKKCRKHLKGVVNGGEAPDLDPEQVRALRKHELKFARCMRDEGIEDWPDPKFSDDGGITIALPDGIETPALKRAQKACRKKVGDPPMIGGGPAEVHSEER